MSEPTAADARLVLLGTGTCQLEPRRMASSALIERDGLRLVYDFGRGVAGRLAELEIGQNDLRHVLLSHFHPDHLSDLIPYLHAACWSQLDPRTEDLHLWGPAGLEAQLTRIIGLFDADTLVRSDRFRIHLHEVKQGRLEIEGVELAFEELPPANNHGLRFERGGRLFALTGDSFFHQQEVDFLTGVDLAVIDSGHLSDSEIVELAARTQAKRIVCSHLYRPLDAGELNALASSRGYAGHIMVGEDLMSFPL